MTAISRHYRSGDVGGSATIDQKLDIFNDRVLGWQIEIAEGMSRQFFEARLAKDTSRPMHECRFAVVSLLFSYFEMIEQYVQGRSSEKWESKKFLAHVV